VAISAHNSHVGIASADQNQPRNDKRKKPNELGNYLFKQR